MMINQDEIKELLPHRYPFLFLDKCNILELGKRGIGYRKFLISEFFFKGHFPNMPIVPGVILVECIAQTSGVVVSKTFSNNEKKSVLFMSINNAKFRNPVFPNDEISFDVSYVNSTKSVYKFFGEAKNKDKKICEATISAMIINKEGKEIF